MNKPDPMEADEQIGVVILVVAVLVIGAAGLGITKVYNELQMTKAYDRQAAALERIADNLDTLRFSEIEVARPPRVILGSPKPFRIPPPKEDGDLWTTCAPGITGRIRDCSEIQKREIKKLEMFSGQTVPR